MFPQLIAGPIVRYGDIEAQLRKRTHSIDGAALGIRKFVLGLGEKALIANALGELCSIFKASEDKSVLFFWLYAVSLGGDVRSCPDNRKAVAQKASGAGGDICPHIRYAGGGAGLPMVSAETVYYLKSYGLALAAAAAGSTPLAAGAIAGAMGTRLDETYRKKSLPEPFYGAYRGQSVLPLECEKLWYLKNDALDGCVVTTMKTAGQRGIYDLGKDSRKDSCELYLFGPVSLMTIKNPSADPGKKLAVFRDSFGSSIASLLAEGYGEIVLTDIRYIPGGYAGRHGGFFRKGYPLPLQRACAEQQHSAEVEY